MSFPTTRLRFACAEPLKYGANAPAQFDDPDWPRFVRITDITEDGRLKDDTFRSLPPEEAESYLLEDGDVLLARSGSIGRSFIYRSEWGTVCHAGYLIRARFSQKFEARFVFWAFNTTVYWAWIEGVSIRSTIQNVSAEKYADFAVPTPHLDTQKRIAAFLDEKTAQIDALIAKKRVLLDRLTEKRQAIITRAVTKGLNRMTKLKDSGIGWLGSVPAHWEVKRLKYVSPRVTVGIVITPAAYYADDGVLALRGLNVKTMSFDLSDTRNITKDGHELNRKSELHEGDLVAVRTGAPGTTAIVPAALVGCNCIDLVIIRKPIDAEPRYLGWFLNSDVAKTQYSLGSEGALQQHFNVETSKEVVLTLPPLKEQQKIAAHIDVALIAHDRQSSMVQTSISRLQEYRAALITNAVTGQIAGPQ